MAILLLDQQKRLIKSQPNEDLATSANINSQTNSLYHNSLASSDNVASEVFHLNAATMPTTNYRLQQHVAAKIHAKESNSPEDVTLQQKSHSMSVIRTRSLREDLIQKLNYKDKMDSQRNSPLNTSDELRCFDNVDKPIDSDGSASPSEATKKFHSDSSNENLTTAADRNPPVSTRRLITTEILASLSVLGNKQNYTRKAQKSTLIRSNVLNNVLPDMNRKLMQSREKASSSDNLHAASAVTSAAFNLTDKALHQTSNYNNERNVSSALFFGSMDQLNCVSTPPVSHLTKKQLSPNPLEDALDNAEVFVVMNRKLGLPPRSLRSTNTVKKSIPLNEAVITKPGDENHEVVSTNHHEDNFFEVLSSASQQPENQKIPPHLNSSIRQQKSPICGSPPKQVTFVLEPDVKMYEISGESDGRKHLHSHSKSKSGARSNSHRSSNHPSAAKNPDDATIPSISISNSTLLLLHERHMDQITWLMKEEMKILENVKQEKFSTDEYRTILSKLISVKAKVVENMQNLMKKSDFSSNS